MSDASHIVGIAIAKENGDNLAEVEWMRRGDARRLCGLGKDILDQWVADEKVEAHKLHPGKNGTVVFCAKDIRKAIHESPLYFPSRCDKPTDNNTIN